MKRNNDGLEVVALAADLSAKEGFFVDSTGAIVASATVAPDALILDGTGPGGVVTLAPCAGGVPGQVTVKLNGTPGSVVKGSMLALVNDGTVKLDPGTGARVLVAQAREPGTALERIRAVLITPVVFAS
jgi:hypothetical protein